METLQKIWDIIAPYFTGGLASGIIAVFIIPLVKGMLTKATSKLNVEGLLKKQNDAIEKAVNDAVGRIKNVSFRQSIQPIVESELERINEKSNKYLEIEMASMQKSNENVIAALAALGAFFDDSIIPESKKEAFRAAIQAATSAPTEQEVVVEELDEKTAVITPAETAAKTTKKKGAAIR